MSNFDYNKLLSTLMTPEIMNAVSGIHEYRGKQDLYLTAEPEIMDKLCEVARIQSTKASNKIENIQTSDKRLRELMDMKVEPRNRDEREIAGYRSVLDMIHSSHQYMNITPNIILQLHRDLYQYSNASFAGSWKDVDNEIVERLATGEEITRFIPTSAVATPYTVEKLCEQYNSAIKEGLYDPLLIAAVFTFDFVSIHPFNDGNGRMSRLLTLLLLYRSNYLVGKYVSIEQAIEKSKETYYETLQASSAGWGEGKNDYTPFVKYILGIVSSCYRTLSERVEMMSAPVSNQEIIRRYFDRLLGPVSKREIIDANPTMSQKTIDRILLNLQNEGVVQKVGAARATRYIRVDTE